MTARQKVASVRVVLDFDPNRPAAAPRPAATIVLLREPRGATDEVEVCVLQRSRQSSFMGGAVVFPGGRVEATDGGAEWHGVFTKGEGPWWDEGGLAARIGACREALEEVGLAPGIPADAAANLRAHGHLPEGLRARGLRFDTASLTPLARWITPEAEARRYDARFFLAAAPPGVEPVADDREAVRVTFEAPSRLLAAAEQGEITLFPPTHRTLELLVGVASFASARALAHDACLDEICPRFLVEGETPILALPGDPAHPVPSARIGGTSRYALRGGRWTSTWPER